MVDQGSGLPFDIRRQIENAVKVYVSVATVWELTLKQTIGKLHLSFSVPKPQSLMAFDLLTIDSSHAEFAGSLPLHHRDPFDRMLVAQAMIEDLTLVTHDATLSQYAVAILKV